MTENKHPSLEEIYRTHHVTRRGTDFVLEKDFRGEFFKELIGSEKRVLDIGCRDGALTASYCFGNDVLGVDIDSSSLSRASSRLGIKTKQIDLNGDWGLPLSSFDAVVAAEVIEHIYYPEIVFEKIHRVLKSGGILVGSVPNAFSLANRLRYMRGTKNGTPLSDPTHINHFSRTELKRLLERNFRDIRIIPVGRFAFLDRLFPGLFSFMLVFSARA
ncbi:MAG: class I SAM-dependent methyltransferase [Patescibacteria group bacterium]